MTDSIMQLNLTLTIRQYDEADNNRATHVFQNICAMTASRQRVALVSIAVSF